MQYLVLSYLKLLLTSSYVDIGTPDDQSLACILAITDSCTIIIWLEEKLTTPLATKLFALIYHHLLYVTPLVSISQCLKAVSLNKAQMKCLL